MMFWSSQATVAALNTELEELRGQLEEALSAHGRELSRLQDSCADQLTCADTALKEVRRHTTPRCPVPRDFQWCCAVFLVLCFG